MNHRAASVSVVILMAMICSCVFGSSKLQDKVCFQNGCVDVKVALKDQDLMRGLQFKKSLPADRGMLFVFPETSLHRFWMKDTLIPLDMVWLDDNKTVIFMESHVLPCPKDPCPVYGPLEPSRYVLEVNAGYAKTLGIHIGHQARFEIHP